MSSERRAHSDSLQALVRSVCRVAGGRTTGVGRLSSVLEAPAVVAVSMMPQWWVRLAPRLHLPSVISSSTGRQTVVRSMVVQIDGAASACTSSPQLTQTASNSTSSRQRGGGSTVVGEAGTGSRSSGSAIAAGRAHSDQSKPGHAIRDGVFASQ